ncbi:MAG: VOC family protein [Betaproteobacteria bacterium]
MALALPCGSHEMKIGVRIVPCLWFDHQAEEAALFYTEVFPDSKIVAISRFGEAGHEVHGRPSGSVMTVAFELDGQPFTALNGGPVFKFNEAVSLQVFCDTQQEVDDYWDKLRNGGDDKAQQCGWLKDKYNVSWQVVPRAMVDMVMDPDHAKSQRVFAAVMNMKKLHIPSLERAFLG